MLHSRRSQYARVLFITKPRSSVCCGNPSSILRLDTMFQNQLALGIVLQSYLRVLFMINAALVCCGNPRLITGLDTMLESQAVRVPFLIS